MQKMLKIPVAAAALLSLFYITSSCRTDKLPEPEVPTFCDSVTATYTATVKDIIDAKCSVGGCHLNAQAPSLNDFTQVFGSKDRISVRALDLKTMPPIGMPQLTEEELKILTCWKEAGYPEN